MNLRMSITLFLDDCLSHASTLICVFLFQYGEIDCWPIECPPPNCDNPTLKEGDCCPRCIEDPCSLDDTGDTNLTSKESGCTYMGRVYRPGDRWALPDAHCTTCKCKVRKLFLGIMRKFF